MIFKCYCCEQYRFWTKKSYQVVLTSNDEELVTKKMCQSCGDQINSQYEAGKAIAELEVDESNE